MDNAVRQWRESGKHLPPIMRDFHDQKDIFKALHEMTRVDEHQYAKSVSWVAGHAYVIDCFLWFMARHGYTLQRCRSKFNFDDLQGNVDAIKRQRATEFEALFKASGEQK